VGGSQTGRQLAESVGKSNNDEDRLLSVEGMHRRARATGTALTYVPNVEHRLGVEILLWSALALQRAPHHRGRHAAEAGTPQSRKGG